MSQYLLISLFFFLVAINCSTTPFSRLYVQTYEPHPVNSSSFFWGLPGNITIFFDEQEIGNSDIYVSVFEKQLLDQESENFLFQYANVLRVDNFFQLHFKANQISNSIHDNHECGLFFDEEETFDIDIPINVRIGSSEKRLMFNFIFASEYQKMLESEFGRLMSYCKNLYKQKKSFLE